MSYDDQALRGDVRAVWPGCRGTGRCRPCGHVHDYKRVTSHATVDHELRCWQNSERGCPDPIPEPEHQRGKAGRCAVCRVKLAPAKRERS